MLSGESTGGDPARERSGGEAGAGASTGALGTTGTGANKPGPSVGRPANSLSLFHAQKEKKTGGGPPAPKPEPIPHQSTRRDPDRPEERDGERREDRSLRDERRVLRVPERDRRLDDRESRERLSLLLRRRRSLDRARSLDRRRRSRSLFLLLCLLELARELAEEELEEEEEDEARGRRRSSSPREGEGSTGSSRARTRSRASTGSRGGWCTAAPTCPGGPAGVPGTNRPSPGVGSTRVEPAPGEVLDRRTIPKKEMVGVQG